MPFIVTDSCKGVKDRACMDECPVSCIYDSDEEDMVYIDPDQCIDCSMCEPVCPVNAIFSDAFIPKELEEYIEINKKKSKQIQNEGI